MAVEKFNLAIFPLAIALCVALCGCEILSSLPEGAPPPGQIVSEIAGQEELPSPDKAVNQMATRITLRIVSISHGTPAMALKDGADEQGLGAELLKSLIASKVAFDASKPNPARDSYLLESSLDLASGKWSVRLLRRADLYALWIDSIMIDARSLQGAAK